jgi:hypothetical protein
MSTQVIVPHVDWVSVLKNELENINTPTFVSLISKVPVEMNKYEDYWIFNHEGKRKKNPNPNPNPYYYEGVYNLSRKYKIVTGFDYVKSVNRRRENEGVEETFEGKENWFNVISKGLVTDKSTGSKFYFRYQYQLNSTLEKEYLYQNDPIGRELFERFEKDRGDYENQGVDDPCRFQVCNLDHILELTINGTKYVRG